jgi:hypothetical protein
MYYFFTWTTGHTEVNTLLRQAVSRWEQLAIHNDLTAADTLDALPPELTRPDAGIPPNWASTYYLLSHPEQVLLAFAWLHWWQQSTAEEPGFAGWLLRGPGFSLNHASLLKVLTQQCDGTLGILHNLLEKMIEQAGDWDGDGEERPEVSTLLACLDTEYRYNIHDRELWPAVLELAQK